MLLFLNLYIIPVNGMYFEKKINGLEKDSKVDMIFMYAFYVSVIYVTSKIITLICAGFERTKMVEPEHFTYCFIAFAISVALPCVKWFLKKYVAIEAGVEGKRNENSQST